MSGTNCIAFSILLFIDISTIIVSYTLISVELKAQLIFRPFLFELTNGAELGNKEAFFPATN
ncbi:hypothetical protein [Cytobacillus oceanisediminis]|uniref:hypothetical protein n=1 Tax=Cytobacillus oceanisediminis TaxID=665099 RepID=UPI000D71D7AB|nr:hypothetical protein [Cytobacillus oceanisediminis]